MSNDIQTFMSAVLERCEHLVSDVRLDPEQNTMLRALVAAVAARSWARSDGPVGFSRLVALTEGFDDEERLVRLAAGCQLYLLSLGAFDDVADRELEGPFDPALPEVANNAALALYTLALTELALVAPAGALGLVQRTLLHHSLRAAAAQHRDLRRTVAVDEAGALLHGRDKCSAYPLFAELAALCCGAAGERVAAYGRIGGATATLRQIANDLHDLYGKRVSGDLARRRSTFPLICFAARTGAAERDTLERLRGELPDSLDAIRRLLYESPALRACAAAMEAARREVHREIAGLAPAGSPLDLHAAFVDSLAAELYTTPALVRATRPGSTP